MEPGNQLLAVSVKPHAWKGFTCTITFARNLLDTDESGRFSRSGYRGGWRREGIRITNARESALPPELSDMLRRMRNRYVMPMDKDRHGPPHSSLDFHTDGPMLVVTVESGRLAGNEELPEGFEAIPEQRIRKMVEAITAG